MGTFCPHYGDQGVPCGVVGEPVLHRPLHLHPATYDVKRVGNWSVGLKQMKVHDKKWERRVGVGGVGGGGGGGNLFYLPEC